MSIKTLWLLWTGFIFQELILLLEGNKFKNVNVMLLKSRYDHIHKADTQVCSSSGTASETTRSSMKPPTPSRWTAGSTSWPSASGRLTATMPAVRASGRAARGKTLCTSPPCISPWPAWPPSASATSPPPRTERRSSRWPWWWSDVSTRWWFYWEWDGFHSVWRFEKRPVACWLPPPEWCGSNTPITGFFFLPCFRLCKMPSLDYSPPPTFFFDEPK